MTDNPARPQPIARYRLRTFGTLALASPDDATLLGRHGHQHRRLALLAVLAAAGGIGRSRDQVLGLFWPDGTQTRARHSLDQLLYAIRSAIDEAVFDGVNPLRLNPDVVSSDVGDFQDALERGDRARAVAEYRGPFLEGFFLAGVPEFERWLDAERARLARSYSGSLEQLARAADGAHDHAMAAHWWRKFTEADPVSSRGAVGLIGALMSAGDGTAALQHAEQYERVVAHELGADVDPAVATLIAKIRDRPKSGRSAVPRGPTPLPVSTLPGAPVSVPPAPPDPPQPQPPPQVKRSPRRALVPYFVGSLVIFVLAAAAILRQGAGNSASRPPADRSIAVLPFVNVTGDQRDAALVDGLSEELIAVLTRIPDLRVIARTSAFAFKNSDLGAKRIADSLGVSNIVEATVQKIGSQLKVHVRLIDARDGSTRWNGTYDRELKDIFTVQSEIAGAVARELDVRLTASTRARIARHSVRNIAAYELYLRGNDPVLLRSDSGARAALEYFHQAIAVDSGYAAAYAGLARLHIRIGVGDDRELSRRERLALAEAAALRAVALDDSSGDAHAALSMVRRNSYDLASAESELRQAIALEPTNARFREWMVLLYIATDRPLEALTVARHALELDPLSPTANAEVANALLANNQCDEALAQLDRLKALRPPLLRSGAIAAQCYARKEMWPEAIAEIERISKNAGPRGQSLLGYMLARAGRTDEAQRILSALLDRSRRPQADAFDVALVYAGLGRSDETFMWLKRSVDDRSLGFEWLPAIADDLRRDPRFAMLQRRSGFGSQ